MNRIAEKIARIFDVVATFAIGGVVVWLGCKHYYEQLDSVLLILCLIGGGIVSSAVCRIFHELGHILIGLICGFRFNSMRVGFIYLYRDEGRLRVAARRLPESLAGATEMLPKNAENLHDKYLAVVCGGLAFSLLFLAGAELALDFYRQLPFAAYALICTALPYAFHIFFYNVLPFNDDNLDTDGAMLKGLIKKEPSYLTAVNILAIEAYLYQGFTPSEIDKQLYFGAPQLPEDDLNFILLTNYRLSYYIDAGDRENAAKACQRLEDLLEYVPQYYKNDITADILYCKCRRGDYEGARTLYPQVRLYLKGEGSLSAHRISAAYELYVNEDKGAALRELNAAEEKAESYYIKGLGKYEHKLLEGIRNDIKTDIFYEPVL